MKKQFIFSVLLNVLFISPSFASNGSKGGNGGGGFICANAANSEFLDFFEAQLSVRSGGLGLHIPVSIKSKDEQIADAFAKLIPGSSLYQRVMMVFAEVKNAEKNPIDPGSEIAWPEDAKNSLNLAGCERKGILLYNDTRNSILYDPVALEDKLPVQQQAVAWVHETVYKFLRETQQDQDSTRARAIVGHLFSDESSEEFDRALVEIAGLNPHATHNFETGAKGVVYFSSAYPGETFAFSITSEVSETSDDNCKDKPWSALKVDDQLTFTCTNSVCTIHNIQKYDYKSGKPIQIEVGVDIGWGGHLFRKANQCMLDVYLVAESGKKTLLLTTKVADGKDPAFPSLFPSGSGSNPLRTAGSASVGTLSLK